MPTENELKAAYLSKFPQFVTWPAATWSGRDHVEICVAQPNPFGATLDALVMGESLDNRTFLVRQVSGPADIDACHVLFISPGGSSNAMLARAASLPILTVGEGPGFLARNGIVGFRVVNGRVRFDVNMTAAQRSGVQISSQMLRLAAAVRGVKS